MTALVGTVRRGLWAIGWPARFLLTALIRVYQGLLGGVFGGQCRFHPSCSRYAEEAIRVHGAVKGTWLAVWRLLRCSPLSKGGADPVPPRGSVSVYDSVIHRHGEAAW